MGIKGKMLKILKSFLLNRSFKVNINDENSDEMEINTGVPQGAILSPLLYNVLLSDLPVKENVKCSSFADDICYFTTARSKEMVTQNMQQNLNKLNDWAKKWNVKINTEKTHFQIFTRKNYLQIKSF